MNIEANSSRKTFRKYLSSLIVVLVLSVFVMPRTSHAFLSWDWIQQQITRWPEKICNPTNLMFENIARDQPQQSIIRFGYNYDTVRFLKIWYNVLGVSPDNAIRCLTTLPGTNFSWLGHVCTWVTGAPSDADCSNFRLTYNYDPNNPGNYASSPGNGSLLSFFNALNGAANSLGNPLDLNYFAYKTFERTPFVGEALAQAPTAYVAPFVKDIYFAWVIVRNLAFGVFALLMLVVGFMMINRSRLNPQAVVTIQYALPKIIISIILIAFSYPIGALILTAVWYIRGALITIVFNQGFNTLRTELNGLKDQYFSHNLTVNIGLILVQTLLSVFLVLGVGVLAMILVLILGLIIIVQWILCIVRMMIYYLKMLFEVVLAPVSFVYAAIPGNDDALSAWFKKMLAYSLSMFALGALPFLVLFVALTVSMGISVDTGITGLGIGSIFSMASGTLALVAGALITYVGFSMTLKLPAQIEETLTGKKKGR